eukprot:COSAG05_NODE_8887_length_664_cov_1.322124_2_plen_65_part_01
MTSCEKLPQWGLGYCTIRLNSGRGLGAAFIDDLSEAKTGEVIAGLVAQSGHRKTFGIADGLGVGT